MEPDQIDEAASPDPAGWDELGVPPAEVAGWKELGFGPFEAAVAHGDGFTPTFAVHYTVPLRKAADALRDLDLASEEGLQWHRAGFTAGEARRWRSRGVDPATARRRRDGYLPPTEVEGS